MAANQRITAKQTKFADCVASGLDLTASYEKAYDTSNHKKGTVYSNACRLAQNTKVVARIKAQQARIETNNAVLALSTRDKVLNKLQDLMKDSNPQSIQLGAAVALGKTIALFTDVIDTPSSPKDLAAIDKEIKARLVELETDAAKQAANRAMSYPRAINE